MTVYIGPNRRVWAIHLEMLCKYSKYFRAALKRNFQEADTKSFEFLEEDEDTFEHFVLWLYGHPAFDRPPNAISAEKPEALCLYVRLYVLASRFMVLQLQNAIVTALHFFYSANVHEEPCMEAVLFLYQNTNRNAELRHLISAAIARYLKCPPGSGKALDMPDAWEAAFDGSSELGADVIGHLFSWRESNRKIRS